MPLRRHPDWIKSRMPSGDNYHELKGLLAGLNLNTVCEEARCPNVGECWDQRTATVMILGDTCTRACGFCAIKTGKPTWFDDDEPRRVAEAVAAMNLDHVVVTSVARDDLPDGGAGAFAATIRELRTRSPGMGVEVLIPDFNGEEAPLRAVMDAGPDILNHNLETVKRLQKPVRKRARWDRTLSVLERAKAYAAEYGHVAHTKSSLMVGLGETRAELTECFTALREVDCDILTIGQYLRPTTDHLPLVRYYHPDEFAEMKAEALALGLQARGVGPAGPVQLPRTRPGPGGGAAGAAPAGDPRRAGPRRPRGELTGAGRGHAPRSRRRSTRTRTGSRRARRRAQADQRRSGVAAHLARGDRRRGVPARNGPPALGGERPPAGNPGVAADGSITSPGAPFASGLRPPTSKRRPGRTMTGGSASSWCRRASSRGATVPGPASRSVGARPTSRATPGTSGPSCRPPAGPMSSSPSA